MADPGVLATALRKLHLVLSRLDQESQSRAVRSLLAAYPPAPITARERSLSYRAKKRHEDSHGGVTESSSDSSLNTSRRRDAIRHETRHAAVTLDSVVSKAVPVSKNGHKHHELHDKAVQLLQFLNEKTGSSFREVDTNLRLIEARLASGIDPDVCMKMIERKCSEWSTNPDMKKYLRPATLFNTTKFEQYIGESERPTAAQPTYINIQ